MQRDRRKSMIGLQSILLIQKTKEYMPNARENGI